MPLLLFIFCVIALPPLISLYGWFIPRGGATDYKEALFMAI